jgi:hypothetical protein
VPQESTPSVTHTTPGQSATSEYHDTCETRILYAAGQDKD